MLATSSRQSRCRQTSLRVQKTHFAPTRILLPPHSIWGRLRSIQHNQCNTYSRTSNLEYQNSRSATKNLLNLLFAYYTRYRCLQYATTKVFTHTADSYFRLKSPPLLIWLSFKSPFSKLELSICLIEQCTRHVTPWLQPWNSTTCVIKSWDMQNFFELSRFALHGNR